MTRDEMIRMAREAGCVIRNGHAYAEHVGSIDQILIRFAAAEREACCGPEVLNSANIIGSDDPHQVYAKLCAAIRARGQA